MFCSSFKIDIQNIFSYLWFLILNKIKCQQYLILMPATLYSILHLINLCQPSVAFHVESSYFICCVNQMTCFCMKCNAGLKSGNITVMYNSSEAATRRASVITGARVLCRWSGQTNGQKESISKGKYARLSFFIIYGIWWFKSCEIVKEVNKNCK